MRKRRKKRRTGFCLIGFMVLIICGIVTYKRQELDIVNAKASVRVAQLEQNIKEEEQKAKEIQEKKAYVQTKKYIEEMAREKLGLVYKDEIIFEPEE